MLKSSGTLKTCTLLFATEAEISLSSHSVVDNARQFL